MEITPGEMCPLTQSRRRRHRSGSIAAFQQENRSIGNPGSAPKNRNWGLLPDLKGFRQEAYGEAGIKS